MKKIIFYSMPGHGHVHPTLNVARELANRGNHVVYYASNEFKSYLQHAGLDYRQYPDDPDVNGMVIKDIGKLLKLISAVAKRQMPQLLEEAKKENPDIIVHDSLGICGKIISRVLHKPAVSLSTTVAYSRSAFLLYPSFTKQVIQSMLSSSPNLFQAWKNYASLGKQYGFQVRGLGDMLMHKEKVNIVFLTRFFQPFGNSFDHSFHFVGPSIYPRIDKSDFMKELVVKKKVIYISYGTFVNDDVSFYEMCIDAFRNSSHQVVISLGNRYDPAIFRNVPKNIIIKKYVNQLEVLQHSSLFIGHGGMNGVSEGLYYGVPMILIPDTEEQRFNSLRVQQTGAGIVLKKKKVTAHLLRETAIRVLNDTNFVKNAQRQQKMFRESGGYKKAADEIEATLAKQSK